MLRIGDAAAAEKELLLIAGAAGLERPVLRTHMVENLEIARLFVAKGEMVFTTGAGLRKRGELFLLLCAAHENGACGVVVNLGPRIPSVPQKLIDYAEANSLPLFSCAWEVHMAEIMHRVGVRAEERESSENEEAELFRAAVVNPDGVRALRRLGFGEGSRFRVAATPERPPLTAHGVYSFEIGGGYATVFSALGKAEIAGLLQGVGAAVSAECGLEGLGQAYGEARRLLAVAGGDAPYFFEDSGVYQLLLGIENRDLLERYCESVLGPLLRYDAQKKSDLRAVLESYIRCNSGLKEVSSELGIHKNTVTNRIHKCEELLGVDISAPEQRLSVEMALAVRRILALQG